MPARAGAPVRVLNFSGDIVSAPSMKRVTITPVAVVEVQHFGADAGLRRLARGDRLVGAVDVFLGALAGNAQAMVARR